jgi:hypothetical protein
LSFLISGVPNNERGGSITARSAAVIEVVIFDFKESLFAHVNARII